MLVPSRSAGLALYCVCLVLSPFVPSRTYAAFKVVNATVTLAPSQVGANNIWKVVGIPLQVPDEGLAPGDYLTVNVTFTEAKALTVGNNGASEAIGFLFTGAGGAGDILSRPLTYGWWFVSASGSIKSMPATGTGQIWTGSGRGWITPAPGNVYTPRSINFTDGKITFCGIQLVVRAPADYPNNWIPGDLELSVGGGPITIDPCPTCKGGGSARRAIADDGAVAVGEASPLGARQRLSWGALKRLYAPQFTQSDVEKGHPSLGGPTK